jgi:hypothetical protein
LLGDEHTARQYPGQQAGVFANDKALGLPLLGFWGTMRVDMLKVRKV